MPLFNPNWFRKPKPGLNEDGHETPDPRPMSPPVGYNRQPSLAEQMREMVRDHKAMMALAGDDTVETFEEADDFDIGDDIDLSTPYEESFDPLGRSSFTPLAEVARQEQAANEAAKAARPPAPSPQPVPQAPAEPAPGDNKPPA